MLRYSLIVVLIAGVTPLSTAARAQETVVVPAKMVDFTDAGILTTASDLLFSGGCEGDFYALDARSGTLLWRFAVGGQVQSGPMTYAIAGRQYVAVNAGNSLYAFALRQ